MTTANPMKVVAATTEIKAWSDREVLDACIAKDQRAWRELVRRFDDPLRGVAYKSLEHLIECLPSDFKDDVMGAFWLKVVDNDMGALRSFDWNEGEGLYYWFSKIVAQRAMQYAAMVLNQPDFAPIEDAYEVPDDGGVLMSGRKPIRGSLSAYVRREKAKQARAVKREDRQRRQKARGDRRRRKRATGGEAV